MGIRLRFLEGGWNGVERSLSRLVSRRSKMKTGCRGRHLGWNCTEYTEYARYSILGFYRIGSGCLVWLIGYLPHPHLHAVPVYHEHDEGTIRESR